ncbi:MAG: hypothetical protein R3352_11760 [Salinisphaeraceae bacterium]|nr:hypothetical protein [Salinisphaeraceae bacterium]
MPKKITQCLQVALLLVPLLQAGCALAPAQTSGAAVLPQQSADNAERLWWAARFKIYWPEGKAPDWAADHLLAHAVAKPIIQTHAESIPLWRFHRRAGPDSAGHQFSFIFYASAKTAQRVLADFEQHPVTHKMLAAGFVTRLRLNSHNYPQRERVEATSDPNWTPDMQRNWPVFIMGVSQLWLGLIDEFARQSPVPESAAEMLAYYRKIEVQVTELWRAQGLHALFHHLSAVFGYAPLPIGEQEVRF